jgi:hypothetical protein
MSEVKGSWASGRLPAFAGERCVMAVGSKFVQIRFCPWVLLLAGV